SRPRLLAVVKPCSPPPVGLPSESVTNVKVGVIPWSSSHVRVPYQSPNKWSRGRINWKGNGVRDRVPADAWISSARATSVEHRKTTTRMGTRVQDLVHMGCVRSFCVSWDDCSRKWRNCAAAEVSATGEILPRMHWRYRPLCNPEAVFQGC